MGLKQCVFSMVDIRGNPDSELYLCPSIESMSSNLHEEMEIEMQRAMLDNQIVILWALLSWDNTKNFPVCLTEYWVRVHHT